MAGSSHDITNLAQAVANLDALERTVAREVADRVLPQPDIDAAIPSSDAERHLTARREIDTMLGSALLNVDQRAAVRARLPFLTDKMRTASIAA